MNLGVATTKKPDTEASSLSETNPLKSILNRGPAVRVVNPNLLNPYIVNLLVALKQAIRKSLKQVVRVRHDHVRSVVHTCLSFPIPDLWHRQEEYDVHWTCRQFKPLPVAVISQIELVVIVPLQLLFALQTVRLQLVFRYAE